MSCIECVITIEILSYCDGQVAKQLAEELRERVAELGFKRHKLIVQARKLEGPLWPIPIRLKDVLAHDVLLILLNGCPAPGKGVELSHMHS